MLFLAIFLGALGWLSMVSKPSLLGVYLGVQLLFMGAGLMFVLSGIRGGQEVPAMTFTLFITVSAIGQLVGGFAMAVRVFYLRSHTQMDGLRSLKR